ncbi:LysR family transcriptional regulator [Dactylosporangium sp. NBC_01737]|uniref:LysR family transcriptional regulator n=1 Tax=Dactylosporangium sp. NBC_01737 TaxID=2975959 RepID=UPI003FA39C43
MAHPTINAAANTIGVNRTTLIEQLRRLETDLGQPLYHRATADGEPHRPTKLGTTLLQTLAQPDIHALHGSRASPPDLHRHHPATSAQPAHPPSRQHHRQRYAASRPGSFLRDRSALSLVAYCCRRARVCSFARF